MGFFRPDKVTATKRKTKRSSIAKWGTSTPKRKTKRTAVTNTLASTPIAAQYIPQVHHKRAIAALVKNKNYGLLLAPGRGKTGIVLEAFKRLKKAGKVDVLIIMAKKKIIMSTWPREIEKWGFPYSYHIANGPKKSLTTEDVILINYEGIGWLEDELYKTKLHTKKRIMCVADESTKICHTNTQRFASIKQVAKLFDRRVILTGSPVAQHMINLWGQIYFLDLGKSLHKFKTHYINEHFDTIDISTKTPGGKRQSFSLHELIKGHEKIIFNKVKKITMRLGESDNLPTLSVIDYPVTLPDSVLGMYKGLEKDFITKIEDGTVTAANAGVLSMRLRQITGGSVYDVDKKAIVVHTEKLDALEDIIDELQGSPCLIGYYFKPERDMIAKRFKQAQFFDAKLNAKQSRQLEDDWNRGSIEVLAGQITTIAHGLNLQESGTHLIIYSPPPSLEDYEQLIKRIHREGQRRSVTVIRLVAGCTIDAKCFASLADKARVQRNFLQIFQDYYNAKYKRK